jgi:hypothetical protein
VTDLVAALVARERDARAQIAGRATFTAIRRQALNDLYKELGTWQKVADATGQKLPTVHKAASQPRKKTS